MEGYDENPSTSALGLVIFLSESPEKLYNRLRLKVQKKKGVDDGKRFHDEKFAIFDRLLE